VKFLNPQKHKERERERDDEEEDEDGRKYFRRTNKRGLNNRKILADKQQY